MYGEVLEKAKRRYRIEGVNQFGIHSNRRRYRVQCLECGEVLHESTTGPICWIEQHEQFGCFADKAEG